MPAKEIDLLPELDRYIRKIRTAKIRRPNGTKIRHGSMMNYVFMHKLLKNFDQKTEFKLRLKKRRGFSKREHQRELHYWEEFRDKFSRYVLSDQNNFDNYLAANMRLLRSFIKVVGDENGIKVAPYLSKLNISKEVIPILVLSPERLNFLIHNKDFDKKLSRPLRATKNIFIVGCAVALRYSDLINLRFSDLEQIGGGTYLSIRSRKTNTFSRVLLPDHVTDILFRDRRKKNYLFNRIALFNFNANLKKIAYLAGWTEEIPKVRSKWGQPVPVYRNAGKKKLFRFCDMISSHMMRRTAITIMLQYGMNENMVRRISGHAPGSAEFYRYVEFSQMYMDQQIQQVYQKLFEEERKNN